MDMRELKGLEIAARAKIVFDGDAWIVPSQTGTGRYKVVLRPDGDTCSRASTSTRPGWCGNATTAASRLS